MPNWCENYLTLEHDDAKQIKRALDAFLANKFLNEFVPLPDNARDWYTWATTNWGTKWDVGVEDGDVLDEQANTIQLRFASAWAPPIAFYDKLHKLGFEVSASYYEGGVGFVGEYQNGADDEYQIPGTSELAKEILPVHLDELFEISSYLEEREREEAEEAEAERLAQIREQYT